MLYRTRPNGGHGLILCVRQDIRESGLTVNSRTLRTTQHSGVFLFGKGLTGYIYQRQLLPAMNRSFRVRMEPPRILRTR